MFIFYRFIFLKRSRREVGRYRPKFVLSVWLPLFRIYSHLSTLKYTEIIFKKVPLVLSRRFCTIVGHTKVDLGTYWVLRGIFKTLFCGSPPIYIYTFRRAIVPVKRGFCGAVCPTSTCLTAHVERPPCFYFSPTTISSAITSTSSSLSACHTDWSDHHFLVWILV